MGLERFATFSKEETTALAEKAENANTKKSTQLWVKVYRLWARHRGKNENLAEIVPANELNEVLRQFYAEVRKQNGKENLTPSV